MKTISLAAAQADLNSLVTDAQSDRVVIERNGRPSAVVVGIEDYDDEDLALASSDAFWQMISERRGPGRSSSLSEVRERLRTKQSE
jgi:prevent-host-death family protein